MLVHSQREVRPRLSREATSVSVASARFSGENTLTSSGCNTYDVCGGRMRRSTACSIQCAIIFAVMWLLWPSMIRSRRYTGSAGFVDGSNIEVSHSNA
jgi:hypothetical protein